MKSFYQHLLCIGLLLEGKFARAKVVSTVSYTVLCSGIFCGQPSLRPLMYSCPNETVTYTCHDSQVKSINWIVVPYVPESDPIIFAASQTVSPLGNEPLNRTPVLATLTSVMNKRGNDVSGWMADMTTTLTVNTTEVENKTNITCQTQKGIHFLFNSTFLYIAGYIELHHNITNVYRTVFFTVQMCHTRIMFTSLTSFKTHIIQL